MSKAQVIATLKDVGDVAFELLNVARINVFSLGFQTLMSVWGGMDQKDMPEICEKKHHPITHFIIKYPNGHSLEMYAMSRMSVSYHENFVLLQVF